LKVLTFSTLFPNAEQPHHGIFVETRLRHLVASGEVEARVMAPLPWFPFRHPAFGRYASFARAPREEVRFGIKVVHPRYPSIPKIGMTLAPFLLASAVIPEVRRVIDEGFDFDLIDAHYFYPDGVAAAMLGRYFNRPVVITARGSDVTEIPLYRLPREMILWAARQARGTITVSNALREALIGMGADRSRIVPLRNGVDLTLFHPVDREVVRKQLGLDGFTLLSAGNLIPLKGHHLAIAALSRLTDVRLLIAGAGPDRAALEALALQEGVADRVTFLGIMPQAALRTYYGAVDGLVLASSREGWPNVLLESMACGTPVIASNVWGIPEVVTSSAAGVLMHERSVAGIVQAVRALRACYPSREATRRYAEQFSWDATTAGQLELFRRVLSGRFQ
jgi:glycosyltransferase involved in cell wall biosynthesis